MSLFHAFYPHFSNTMYVVKLIVSFICVCCCQICSDFLQLHPLTGLKGHLCETSGIHITTLVWKHHSFLIEFKHLDGPIRHSSSAVQVCLTFSGEMQEKTHGMCAVLMDRGINRGIVPDLPTPDPNKTNSPPMGPEQIKYTLPSSTPGVTVIRGGLSAWGTEKGR